MLLLDHLLIGVKDACAAFPGKRKGGDATYAMADIGLSAFSLFFMQSESFLSRVRQKHVPVQTGMAFPVWRKNSAKTKDAKQTFAE